MQIKLVQIGNSRGICLPKNLIEQFGLDKGTIELIAEKDGIMIKPKKSDSPRDDWDSHFAKAKAACERPGADAVNNTPDSAAKTNRD